MKKLFLALLTMLNIISVTSSNKVVESSDMFGNLKKGEKAAILMVHFGTTHDRTRSLTIDAINKKAQEHFPNITVFEAYTSRIVIKRLKERGIVKYDPTEAITLLKSNGYTHILIQPTTIIDGVEMESLNQNVNALRQHFKEIRMSTPLLFYEEDYHKVIDALTENSNKTTAYVLVGHGTYDVATAQYAMLDYMLRDKGYKNFVVGCVEGYPFYEQALRRLTELGLKYLRLVPLMFVAGEHAQNDIAKDWREDLEKAGFEVEISMQGLGEIPAIQNRFIEILDFYSKNRRLGIMEKKQKYEITGKKMSVEE